MPDDIPVARQPLGWYVEKLQRREPLVSLLYGDGEFLAAIGSREGQLLTEYLERVTPSLIKEMRASFMVDDPNIIRGTDVSLLNPHHYQGADKMHLTTMCEGIPTLWRSAPHVTWVDGTVWEDAVRRGQLGLLLRVLHGCDVALVSNPALHDAVFLHPRATVVVPFTDAWRDVDRMEGEALSRSHGLGHQGRQLVFILCCGLGAIPLAMRLRRHRPDAAILDLGSTFDVFVGKGEARGWRDEVYADPVKWQALIKANLSLPGGSGSCGPWCGTYKVSSAQPGGDFWVEKGVHRPDLPEPRLAALRRKPRWS